MKNGIFVKKQLDESFCFDLLADDGLVLCRSQAYALDAGCLQAIESVRKNCSAPIEDRTADDYEGLKCPKYEVYRDSSGGFRFRLKSADGEVVAYSPGFAARYTCQRGIEAVMKYAPDAEIVVPTYAGEAANFTTGQALDI